MASRLHQIAREGRRKEGDDFFRGMTVSGAKKAANAVDKMKRTPLHLACWAGNTDMISLLLEHRADCMATAQDAFTPLHFCSQACCVEGCQMLLRAGARVDAKLNKSRKTALHLAAAKGHAEVVRVLVKSGAKTFLRNTKGETPLDIAANVEVRAALAEEIRPSLAEGDVEKAVEGNLSVLTKGVEQGGEGETGKYSASIEGGVSKGGDQPSTGAGEGGGGGGGGGGSTDASDEVRGSIGGAQETGLRVVDKLDGDGFGKGGAIGKREGVESLAERRRKKRKLAQANASRKETVSLPHLDVDGDKNDHCG